MNPMPNWQEAECSDQAVGFFSVANTQDGDLMRGIVNAIDDSVITLPKTVHIFRACQFLRSVWAGIGGKIHDLLVRAGQIGLGKATEFFASRRNKRDVIKAHPASARPSPGRAGCEALLDVPWQLGDRGHLPGRPAVVCTPLSAIELPLDAPEDQEPLVHAAPWSCFSPQGVSVRDAEREINAASN